LLLVFLLSLLLGFNPISGCARALTNSYRFYALVGRSGFISIPFNAVVFAGFTGWPWTICFAAALFGVCRELVRGRQFRWAAWTALPMDRQFLVLTGAMLVGLLLSGGTRGEVERNWMILMPFVLVPGTLTVVNDAKRFYCLSVIAVVHIWVMASMIEAIFTF